MQNRPAALLTLLILFFAPTPLAAATEQTGSNQTVAPSFSVTRGFFGDAFQLELSTVTPGAMIVYTTDGSTPTSTNGIPTNGTSYFAPIGVGTTVVVSARAYMPDGSLTPSPVEVHSYIFVRDVATQGGFHFGYPAEWEGATADYALDPEVTRDPAYAGILGDGLLAIPTLSLAIDTVDLFDEERGIYTNAQASGRESERPASAELLYPSGRAGFQIHAGIRIHGQASREIVNSPKHSFRLLFKNEYGAAKLEFPLFEDPKHSTELHRGDTEIHREKQENSVNLSLEATIHSPLGFDRLSPRGNERLPLESPCTSMSCSIISGPEGSWDDPADKFDTLILRAGYNRSWIHPSATQREQALYSRDLWAMQSQAAMGQPATHGLHVHLYINGLYWGLYTLHERPSAPFMATYFGGDPADYDVLNSGEAVDGDTLAWDAMMAAAKLNLADPANYAAVAAVVDLENLADYMILNHYAGNRDWDRKNWYAARLRSQENDADAEERGSRFRFFAWDTESILSSVEDDQTGVRLENKPSFLFYRLMQIHAFRMLFADRIYKHLYNDGALTPAAAGRRMEAIAAQVADAVVAESARWGDYRRDVYPVSLDPRTLALYTRNDHWLRERQRLKEEYFPQRTAVLLGQYRTRGFYPSIEPPTFAPTSRPADASSDSSTDAAINVTVDVRINNPNGPSSAAATGTIWYTVDGSDPHQQNGLLNPQSKNGGDETTIRLTRSTLLQARVHNEATGAWSALHATEFFPAAAAPLELRITELMINAPAGSEHEFIEVQNVGKSAADLGGAYFASGIRYRFPAGTTLGSGDFLVLARIPEAFGRRYGFSPFNQRGYSGKLANDGESIRLNRRSGEELFSVEYSVEGALISAAGAGFSLVRQSTPGMADGTTVVGADIWRVSSQVGGSPGRADPSPAAAGPTAQINTVQINEVLAQGDRATDFVELYNASATTTDLSGWFLTNDPTEPRKFRIPDGTELIPYGFASFSPQQIGFELDASGGAVYLFAIRASGELSRYGHAFVYGAAEDGLSYGLCTIAPDILAQKSEEYVVPQQQISRGVGNGQPVVGPVVFGEIMYHPANEESGDEYIALANVTNQPMPLYDPTQPANVWRVRGIGDFTFPPQTQIAANGTLLVVPTEPAAFRRKHNVPAAIPIFGPYVGTLANGGETLTLERPSAPGKNGLFHYIPVDIVKYADQLPWPVEADGTGASLVRITLPAFGGAAQNWRASTTISGAPRERQAAISVGGTETRVRRQEGIEAMSNPVSAKTIFLPLVFHQTPTAQANSCFVDLRDL